MGKRLKEKRKCFAVCIANGRTSAKSILTGT